MILLYLEFYVPTFRRREILRAAELSPSSSASNVRNHDYQYWHPSTLKWEMQVMAAGLPMPVSLRHTLRMEEGRTQFRHCQW